MSRAALMIVVLVSVMTIAPAAVAVDIGDPAPDFTLPATTGGEISLSQFRGKQPVLVEFYSMDFSPV